MSAPLHTNLLDASGTVTTGATAQTALAANLSRTYVFLQNLSVGDLYVNFGTTAVATQPSIRLIPGGSIEFSPGGTGVVPNTLVSVIGATTGQAFCLKYA